MSIAYIALGTNLGDKESNLRLALALLEERGVKIIAVAPFLPTEPYGVTDQPDFLNTAACIGFDGTPQELLTLMLKLESDMGRKRLRHWGERIIDLDLLLFEDRIIDEPSLTVPHPDMANREFVLAPLAVIAPLMVHPVLKQPIYQLLVNLRREDRT